MGLVKGVKKRIEGMLDNVRKIVAIIAGIVMIIATIIAILLSFSSSPCPPNHIIIQGTVVDVDNNPVSGALVTIDGHSDLTDSNGEYIIYYIIRDVTKDFETIEVKSAKGEYRNAITVRNGDGIIYYDVLLITKPS